MLGDRLHFRRSSGLHLLLRLLSVVAALLVLCVSSRASAAGNQAVPMCGDRNESIAAPPIFRAYQAGSITASPCHSDELQVGSSAPLAPERIVIQERPERVLGFGSLLIAQSQSSLVSIAGASTAPELPGFVDSLFRPPRA